MSYVVFVAPVTVVTGFAGTPAGTVFGAGHLANISGVSGEEDLLRGWQRDGKIGFRAPVPRGIRVTPIAATTATVNWTVDEPCSGMLVNYGTTSSVASTQNATPVSGTGDVVANLTGLTTATLYFYRVSVNNPAGTLNTISPVFTFTTL